jgi:hypothetical protein
MTSDNYKKMFDLLSRLMILHGTRQIIESHGDACELSDKFEQLIFEIDIFLGCVQDPKFEDMKELTKLSQEMGLYD